MSMLGDVCAEIRNYFTYENDKMFGNFRISNGHFEPLISFPTDYIRIVGSRLNDGVHKVSEMFPLSDESFNGAVWVMSPPRDFLALVKEIEDWQKANGAADSAAMSPFTSESFGGYSYSKSTGSGAGAAGGVGWLQMYASRLNQYRRIRV